MLTSIAFLCIAIPLTIQTEPVPNDPLECMKIWDKMKEQASMTPEIATQEDDNACQFFRDVLEWSLYIQPKCEDWYENNNMMRNECMVTSTLSASVTASLQTSSSSTTIMSQTTNQFLQMEVSTSTIAYTSRYNFETNESVPTTIDSDIAYAGVAHISAPFSWLVVLLAFNM